MHSLYKNSLNEIRLIKKIHDFFKRISLQIDYYRETIATFSVTFINEVFKVNKNFFSEMALRIQRSVTGIILPNFEVGISYSFYLS